MITNQRNLATVRPIRNFPPELLEEAQKEVVDPAVQADVAFAVERGALQVDDDHLAAGSALRCARKIASRRNAERGADADVEVGGAADRVGLLEDSRVQVLAEVDDRVAESAAARDARSAREVRFVVSADAEVAVVRFAADGALFDR